ncbi:MAG: hypothetical protein ACP5KB_03685 [Thermoprotei archaeon]
MGGGKKKKTITAAEKAQKKEELKEVKKPEKKEKTLSAGLTEIDESLLSRALSTLKSSNVMTTYQLATTLGIKMSLAKKLIKELSTRGEIKVVDKFRSLYILVAHTH